MIIAGKCPPEKEELDSAKDRGFENVELYLEKKHIDNFEQTLQNCKDSDLNIVSVHTPHVTTQEPEYFDKAGELAENLDAKLVFHSQYTHHVNIPEMEDKTDINADYGYENNPGISVYAIENLILDRGYDMVLDTAHLFIGEENFLEALRHLLNHQTDKVKLVHLCDSTTIKDGLAFGEGEMDMEQTCKAIHDSDFDGIVVLEVMPEHQEAALEKWQEYTS